LQKYFSAQEWKYYQQLIQQSDSLLTSSMGRFLDGIASILGVCQHNSYEGEAAMKLEVLAESCLEISTDYYPIQLQKNRIDWSPFISALLHDIEEEKDVAVIAWKVFYSLYKMIAQLTGQFNATHVAFSGGVFQNALLVNLLTENMGAETKLFFHRQLSPNDECIGFGQIACFEMENKLAVANREEKNAIDAKQFQLIN
jgi:hydrogenase maturation protein HypF